jgi:hypothetical protein
VAGQTSQKDRLGDVEFEWRPKLKPVVVETGFARKQIKKHRAGAVYAPKKRDTCHHTVVQRVTNCDRGDGAPATNVCGVPGFAMHVQLSLGVALRC